MNALVPVGSTGLVPRDFDEALRLAKAMSQIPSMPKHLHGDVGTCVMIVDQAMRWRMSPFAVAQCSSNINGKMMYEGKILAAAVESMGAITGGFDYKFSGEGDGRTVTASAVRTGETKPREVTVKLSEVKTNNPFWVKQPDQQLVYSSSRIWARRWTPAALLGAYAPEEFDRKTGRMVDDEGPTIDAVAEPPTPPKTAEDQHDLRKQINEEVKLNEPAATRRQVDIPPTENMSPWQWLDAFEIALRDAKTPAEINRILGRHEVAEMENICRNRPKTRDRLAAIKAAAQARGTVIPDDLGPPIEHDENGTEEWNDMPDGREPVDADGVPA